MQAASLALVLALDSSASVTLEEFNLMAGGLAASLRDPLVIGGLTGSPGGSQAALLLWSGVGEQGVLIDWTRIGSEAEALAFADTVENVPRIVRAGLTALGEALEACADLLDLLPVPALRLVVDVVGDGRANAGVAPDPVRDRMAAAGITINGLCVLHEEPDLLDYYQQHVIGGPGAFALPCADFSAFTEAMTRKLTREIAGGADGASRA